MNGLFRVRLGGLIQAVALVIIAFEGTRAPSLWGVPVLPVEGPFILEREGYTVCYDGRSRIPYWVYELITSDNLQGPGVRRASYCEDPDLPDHVRSDLRDYERSGYSRGHLAAAGNHTDSQENIDETFFLTNMVPQNQVHNSGVWQQLERWVRSLVGPRTWVHVITGPLFLPTGDSVEEQVVVYHVVGRHNVAVPTHLYKIVITEDTSSSLTHHAFIIPNRPIRRPVRFEGFEGPLEEVLGIAGIALVPALLPQS